MSLTTPILSAGLRPTSTPNLTILPIRGREVFQPLGVCAAAYIEAQIRLRDRCMTGNDSLPAVHFRLYLLQICVHRSYFPVYLARFAITLIAWCLLRGDKVNSDDASPVSKTAALFL
jgi:hypothetical protein